MSFLESSTVNEGRSQRSDSAADILRAESLLMTSLDNRRAMQNAIDPPIDPGHVHEFGTTVVSYKDGQIDNELAFSQARNLKITDIPNDCRISAWKDSIGYFFYFTDGRDGKKHHYIPASCQFIQAVQENGKRDVLSVYELKQQVDKAMKDSSRRNTATV